MREVKIWVDDIREAPDNSYLAIRSVNDCISQIENCEKSGDKIVIIDIDHDAGDYNIYGGDYIRILDWLEATNRNYPIRIHSMNPVGVENMRRIIHKNGWTEIK